MVIGACATIGSSQCTCEPERAQGGGPDATAEYAFVADSSDSSNSSDDASDVHVPPDSGLGWVNDLALWKSMPTASGCETYYADPTSLPVATRTWSECGIGCQVASAQSVASLPQSVVRNPTGVAYANGDTYLRTYSILPASHPNLWLVSRLLDGAILGAVQLRNWNECFGYALFPNSADMVPVVRSGTGLRVARVPLTSPGSPVWSPWSVVPGTYSTGFAAPSFWGIGTLTGSVETAQWPGGTLSPSDTNAVSFSSAARDDLAVWATQDAKNRGVVRAFSPSAKKVWTLVDQPGQNAVVVALTQTRITWVSVTGPLWASGSYQGSALWTSALTAPVTTVVPVKVADLQAVAGFLSLQSGTTHAATLACFSSLDGGIECQVLVVSISTGAIWKLPHRPGKIFHTVLSVDDQEILLGEADNPTDPGASQRIDSLVRLRLDALDTLKNGWAN